MAPLTRLSFVTAASVLLLLGWVQRHSTATEVRVAAQHQQDATTPPPGREQAPQIPTMSTPPISTGLALECDRLFIDGGSNMGESVAAFAAGSYFGCALSAPHRVYRAAWPALTAAQRREVMRPLTEPRSWCIRSFEAAPALLPPLLAQQTKLRADGLDVTFVDGALGNASAPHAARDVVTYSRHPAGESAVSMAFEDIHVEPCKGGQPEPCSKPAALSRRTAHGPSYDVRAIVRAALRSNASALVALRLDVEGAEWSILEALLEPEAELGGGDGKGGNRGGGGGGGGDGDGDGDGAAALPLLCAISYVFVEFHGSATEVQRARLPRYGIASDAFESLKTRVHRAMERPGCRLQIYWRSFWASCGDKQRFEWRDGAQATAT